MTKSNAQVAATATTDYSGHNVADLKKLAAEKGCKVTSKTNKTQLLEMLAAATAPAPVKEAAKKAAPRSGGER